MWWTFQGRRAAKRLDALVMRSARGNPTKTRLLELCRQADADGIDTLSARQQLVVRTYAARGIIGNGGFRYFLEGLEPLAPVADGFRTLGFDAAGAACERVIAAVAAQPLLTEQARRAAIHDAPDSYDVFRTENSAVFAVEFDELEAAIGRYMRLHPREFPGLG